MLFSNQIVLFQLSNNGNILCVARAVGLSLDAEYSTLLVSLLLCPVLMIDSDGSDDSDGEVAVGRLLVMCSSRKADLTDCLVTALGRTV